MCLRGAFPPMRAPRAFGKPKGCCSPYFYQDASVAGEVGIDKRRGGKI